MKLKTLIFLIVCLVLVVGFMGLMQAHDFWLITNFFPRKGQTIQMEAHTGDRFPVGNSAVAQARISRFDLYRDGSKKTIDTVQELETQTNAEVTIERAGTIIAAIEIKPRFLKMDASAFNEYLDHEGLSQVLKLRAKADQSDSPGRELYAKYAKAIIHAGDSDRPLFHPRDDVATRPVGLKLEIVPLKDPLEVLPGSKLPIRVLFEGHALADAQVACVSDRHAEEGDYSLVTRTNQQGIAMIPIQNPGNWLVRLVHMMPAGEGHDHDWESFFSTLTFRIPPERGFPLTVESIMRGPDLVGFGISAVRWAGDSSRLYFDWRKPLEKESHTYILPRGGGVPRKLTPEEKRSVPPAFGGNYSKDRRKVVFAENGDIFLLDTVNGQRIALLQTSQLESSPRFTQDEKKITFVRNNNLYRLSLDSTELVQLTDIRPGPKKPEPKLTESQTFLKNQQLELFETVRERVSDEAKTEAKKEAEERLKPIYLPKGFRVSSLRLSPDESRVLVTASKRAARAKASIVANYVTDNGYTQDIPSRTKVGDASRETRMALVTLKSGKVLWIDHGRKDRTVRLFNPIWSEDGRHLLITGVAADHKDRWFLLVDRETGKTRVVETLHDDAWVAGFRFGTGAVGWMPDNQSIYFISEKDGYFQLYSAGIDGAGTKALTSGKFEVFSPFLSHDKSRFYFTSSEVHPGERHFYWMPLTGGKRTQITSMAGRNRVTLSPDERTIANIYSYSNKPPELVLMDNEAGAKATQITLTPTEEWRSFPWVDPRLITFQARDGAQVYAHVYTPELLDESFRQKFGKARRATRPQTSKQPGVIFVHGAGYTQNVHRYWPSYYREYMFHHILMDRGYVVMDIDYRASSGYGRDWRTAIYRHMGGKDLDDQVDAAKWMTDHLNVDPDRIGIYGGSYGGFITLMAMFTAPDTFAAGASLRPVTDWAHYNHGYTSNILNVPQDDQEAYTRSSPIYFAEGLKGALLICHGVVDTNVHFQDTVRLVQRLIELRKENWEVAIYPVEGHGFRRSDSWTDEYRRILQLFETHLKGK